MKMRFRAKSSTNVNSINLEDKIAEMAERLFGIADKYFKHPLKTRTTLTVPFEENDVLTIKFREPIAFEYMFNTVCYTGTDVCDVFVSRSFAFSKVIRLEWVFQSGTATAVDAKIYEGDKVTFTIFPGIFELALLFVPETFKKLKKSRDNIRARRRQQVVRGGLRCV